MKNLSHQILPVFCISIILLGVIAIVILNSTQYKILRINSYEECLQAGYGSTKGIPPHCNTPDGRDFVAKSTIRGKLVCLPHKNKCPEIQSDPNVLCSESNECRHGFRDNAGTYYSYIFKDGENTLIDGNIFRFPLDRDKEVEIAGTVMRTSENNNRYVDQWTIYIESIKEL